MRWLVQDSFAEPGDRSALRGEPLVIHLRTEPTRNRALIIFVHGLGGSRYGPKATWGFLPRFVFEDFPDVDVGLYEYVTLFRRLKFWESIDLSKEAVVFADLIRDVTSYEVVILVGHSMGGLLCQAAVVSLVQRGEEQSLHKIGGIILMATPQTGSQRVPSALSFLSRDAFALRPHGAFVTSIQRTLTDRLFLLEEGSAPSRQYRIPTWAILGSSDFWVDQLSAQVGLPSSQTKTIRGSHTQIVKPSNKQHDGYDFIYRCIRRILIRYSASTDGQQHKEELKVTARLPASRIPAVGIFLDRQETIVRIMKFLDDPTRKLAVISGLPGIGKSTLAAKVAHDVTPHFQGVFWMTCSRERSTADVLFGQLNAFLEKNGEESLRGLWNAPAPILLPAKIDALVDALSRNRYLLVFDEIASWFDEQFQVKNPDVRRVLHGLVSSAHVSKVLLITERKPFFDPQNSPIPPGVLQNEELFGLQEADGIILLKEYLPGEDEALLRKIVESCGANPLMLCWFGYLIASGRQDATTVLDSEGIELFRKLLSGTVEDLTEESREALERLAIFRVPLPRKDLERLQVPFQAAVVPLVDRFLAMWYRQDDSVVVMEPVKTFVLTRLKPEKLRRLHLEAVALYEAKQPTRRPSSFREAEPILEKAYHLAEMGDGLKSADAFLGVSGLLIEWGYLDFVRDQVSRMMESVKADPLRKARCLWTLADIEDLRSEYPAALDLFYEALKASEIVQDYEGTAKCHWRIGRLRNALDDLLAAHEEFRLCIEICDQQKIIGPKSEALLDQAWTLARENKRDQALALMEHSLELATSAGDFQTQAKANRQIGWILWDYRRETDKSRKYYQRSLEIATAHGLLKELGAVHGDLGYLQNQWGDSQAAEESCRTAIAIREALGDQHGLASAYLNLGLVFQSQKAYVEENRCYEQSLDIYRRLKVPSGEAEVLLHQGIAWREQEQLIESEKTLQQVLALVESHDLSLTRGDVLYQMGRTVLLSGRKEEARSWLTGAVEQANKIKSPRAAEYTEFLQNYIDLLRLPDHGLN